MTKEEIYLFNQNQNASAKCVGMVSLFSCRLQNVIYLFILFTYFFILMSQKKNLSVVIIKQKKMFFLLDDFFNKNQIF